jgi:DNA-binding CsgD family transcriptional regulator
MSVSSEQKEQILALIEKGLASQGIAQQLGVGKMVVAGYRASLARERNAETEEVIAAVETTFGLERDLQSALRNNIDQLEAGLKIADGGKEQSRLGIDRYHSVRSTMGR